ncbi:RB-associated KRAB zinc finger protein-like [Culicoides brevitarsis]|uniref:RB-associated KRAB zinc finger protein-like n=1 Tax=Culicoides brevitarsis TaxID=469753 RepID=UPI00307C9BDC
MFLQCICRLCLTKFDDPNQLFVSYDYNLDYALASIFNKEIQPEFHHLYKICGPCGNKLLDFHNFYVSVLQNEEKLLDIVLNQKLGIVEAPIEVPSPPIVENSTPIYEEISSGSLSLPEEDIEMSDDGDSFHENFIDSSSSVTSTCENDPNLDNCMEKFMKLSEPQPMEVETIKTHEDSRRKTRCNECGVYVMNLSQHKRCVHEFSGQQKCEDCNSVFTNRLKLLMHRYYKHVPPRFECPHCDKKLRTKGLLREHIYQKHCEGVYLYQCDYCEAQFNYRTSLVIHQKRLHKSQYEIAKNHRMAMRYRP